MSIDLLTEGCYNGLSIMEDHMGRPKTHGLSGYRIYETWSSMMGRCYSPRSSSYEIYGGRGITVCEEWHDPAAFAKWAHSNGYKHTLQIDRIDNSKGYEPSNCRWVTCTEQVRNRSNTVHVEAFGETKPLGAWAEDARCVVTYKTLHKRIYQRGWPPERAITMPNVPHGHMTQPRRRVKE